MLESNAKALDVIGVGFKCLPMMMSLTNAFSHFASTQFSRLLRFHLSAALVIATHSGCQTDTSSPLNPIEPR